ncbi:hypothetical protein PINS_up021427 [Pythium insidiosum]|nr:hypothetical protein PINS_up021427 [Pythium insidiosum]
MCRHSNSRSPTRALDKLIDNEDEDRVEDHFVDLKLLQVGTPRRRMTELFNASETQHIMIRRFGFIFRARGVRDQYSGRRTMHRSIFGQAVRLIIPHCSDRDVDELWEAVGSASDSSIHAVAAHQTFGRRGTHAVGKS